MQTYSPWLVNKTLADTCSLPWQLKRHQWLSFIISLFRTAAGLLDLLSSHFSPEWQLQGLRQLCWPPPSHRQLPHVQRSPSLTDRSCLGVATEVGGEESWREDESSAKTHIHSLSLSDSKGSAFDKGHRSMVVAQDSGTWPLHSHLASLPEPESWSQKQVVHTRAVAGWRWRH